jgi:hypothetical protein
MKRTLVFAAALVGLACSGAGRPGGGGGTAGTRTGSGGSTVGNAAGSEARGGGASGAGGLGSSYPGTGGAARASTGGATNPGLGGAGRAGSGGATRAALGGSATAGSSASAGGSTGGGGATIVATGPITIDPVTATADLAKYYISNRGNDANSGTSPEQPWATLGKIPRGKVAVFFDRGSTWTITVGGTTRSGLSLAAGSVYAAYGTGDRPLFQIESSDGKTQAMGAVLLGGNNLVEGIKVKGWAAIAFPVSSDNNVVQSCEVDGTMEGQTYGKMQLGFSISGQHNLIVGNYVHDLSGLSGDTGNVNTSGGSEAFVMHAGNNEVAYNTAVNCWVPNQTLNGAEGGCLEIIGNKAAELIENAFFHHNYCERSVGLFEACAGNFSSDGKKIQLNHAIVRHSTVAYNVAVDAMWLYLLQPVNTDFDGLIFEHNTLIHGPANSAIPQGGAAAFGIAYDTDPVWTAGATPTNVPCTTEADCGEQELCLDKQGAGKICQYQWKLQPGNITVRNNLFVVLPGADSAMMVLPPGPNDFYNNLFAPKAPMGVKTGGNGIIAVADAGLVDTYKLAPSSPAVDKGSPDAMHAWLDWAGHPVPCGSAPDIGAVEYCP